MRSSHQASRTLLILGLLLAVCVGCSPSNTAQTTPSQPASGQSSGSRPAAVQPEADKAVVTGQAINQDNQKPIPNVIVRLAEIYWNPERTDAALALDEANSPATIADAQGYFVFNNIPAREYAIIFRSPNRADSSGDVIVSEKGNANRALLINPAAGQTTDVGGVAARRPE
ncbi:MAG TPA: hypothetical protein VFS21_29440 [Roseiflexaceae bacterium]|nr:hypothetical protein [Roseiflexaceae bacterium]